MLVSDESASFQVTLHGSTAVWHRFPFCSAVRVVIPVHLKAHRRRHVRRTRSRIHPMPTGSREKLVDTFRWCFLKRPVKLRPNRNIRHTWPMKVTDIRVGKRYRSSDLGRR